jgi:phage-related protein (TIGR01555 family)
LPPNPGFKVTRDGGLILHPSLAVASDNTMQNTGTDMLTGAGFGDAIPDSDRLWMSQREPVAHFLTCGVAADITEKWFTINDPDTEEADPALDRSVQDALATLKFKHKLTKAIEPERIYGWSLLVGAFADAVSQEALSKPLRQNSELKQLTVYPKTAVRIVEWEKDPMSPRYGEPVIYELDRGNGLKTPIHYTRTCLVKTRGAVTKNALTEQNISDSVLDPVWDDMTCGRNIRWGAAQWMYRTGSGFAVISFPEGSSVADLEAWSSSGAFANLMSRTYICLAQNSMQANTGMTFEFKGAAGATLDPVPFFKTNVEQIAIATGIPQAKLVGAQAGAVTGSEINMQDYYKMISRCQSALEDVVRWVIDRLAESGQIKLVASNTATDKLDKLKLKFAKVFGRDYRHRTAQTYLVEWNSAFELSEKDEATIDETHTRSNVNKLKYMSKDEVRAEDGLDPLPDGAGEWKDVAEGLQLFNQNTPSNDPKNPSAKQDPDQNKKMQETLNNSDTFITFVPRQQAQGKPHEHPANNS